MAISRAVALGSWERRAECECRIAWRAVRCDSQRDGGRLERVILPAPPWIIMRGVVWGGFEEVDMVGFGGLMGSMGLRCWGG